jgi:RNA polymerase sigma factor (sigma-70 family)
MTNINVSLLLNDLKQCKILDDKIVRKHLFNIKKTKSVESRCIVVESYLRLVWSIARKYTASNFCDFADLVWAWVIWLNKSIDNRDSTKNNKFWSYVVRWIEQSMSDYLFTSQNVISLPNYTRGVLKDVSTIGLDDDSVSMSNIFDKISKKHNIKEDTLSRLISSSRRLSLWDRPLDWWDTYWELSPSTEDIVNDVNFKMITENLIKILNDSVWGRDAIIFRMRHWIWCPVYTLVEISRYLEECYWWDKLSSERIRQIQQQVLFRLLNSQLLHTIWLDEDDIKSVLAYKKSKTWKSKSKN